LELLVESSDIRALNALHKDERTVGERSIVELTIVMPCLNEAETLAKCINKAARFLEASGVKGEIVIGDNGSTDGSIEIAERNGARVVDVPIRGYGAAVYHAALAAKGRYVIMGDADDSYDFSALAPLVAKLREGYDVVMGNRFLGGIRPGAMPWKNRYIGNPILSSIGRLFFRCPARDFHCGLRGFSAEAFRRMDLRTTGMEFAPRDANRRSAHDPRSGRPVAPTPFTSVARWLAAPAVHAAFQSALAVSHTWAGSNAHRDDLHGVAVGGLRFHRGHSIRGAHHALRGYGCTGRVSGRDFQYLHESIRNQ
jgi:glycosyltransferase involved in cell wall biosynthesis